MFNQVYLIGKVYAAEAHETKTGNKVLNARMSVVDSDTTTKVDLVFWGAIAEKAIEIIDFEDNPLVYINGSLQQNKWINENGENRTKLVIKVSKFFLLKDLRKFNIDNAEE